ncbi:VOC family protein [Gracilimonas sp.]
MSKIRTCFWFDSQAEEAAKFYTSVSKDSKIKETVGCKNYG